MNLVSGIITAFAEESEVAAEELSWGDKIAESFSASWWSFFIGLCVILAIMLVLSIISKGKIITFRRVIKVGINAALGFVLLFGFNCIASIWNAQLVAQWYEWLIIGAIGLPGTILCIILHFIYPGIW